MKKIFVLSIVCLFAASVSFAGVRKNAPDPGFSIIQNGSVLKVLYKSDKPANVKVSILNSENQRIFSEVVKQTDGFARPYNMSSLPEGEYIVELADRDGATRRNVVISEEKKPVEKKDAGKQFHIEPVTGEEGKVFLMAAKNAGTFSIKVIDERGNVVYRESKKVSRDFAQVYDVSILRGDGTVIVTDQNGNEETLKF